MDIISILAGGLVGFFVAIGKDLLLENKKRSEKKIELKRERLEELYIGFSKWSNHVISEEMTLLSVMENKITFNDYLDLKIEKIVKFDAQKNEMILKVYAENLLTIYEEVREQLVYLNSIEKDFKNIYSTEGQHITESKQIEGNKLFTERFEEKSNIFKIKLADEIKRVL